MKTKKRFNQMELDFGSKLYRPLQTMVKAPYKDKVVEITGMHNIYWVHNTWGFEYEGSKEDIQELKDRGFDGDKNGITVKRSNPKDSFVTLAYLEYKDEETGNERYFISVTALKLLGYELIKTKE